MMFHDLLKSPELLGFCSMLKEQPVEDTAMCNLSLLAEFSEKEIMSSGDYQCEQLIAASGITKTDQEILFRQFLMLCFPALFMNKVAFIRFASGLGSINASLDNIFSAADESNQHALSFWDFLCILAAMEQSTPDTQEAGEMRCHYIFRAFDVDRDNKLSYSELTSLVTAIIQSQPGDASRGEKQIKMQADRILQNVNMEPGKFLSEPDFQKAVFQSRILGTSRLLRNPVSVPGFISQKSPFLVTQEAAGRDTNLDPNKGEPLAKSKAYKGRVSYELALHTVKLNLTGAMAAEEVVTDIPQVVYSVARSASETLQQLPLEDSFNLMSVANQLLRGLVYYVEPVSADDVKKSPSMKAKPAFSWGEVDMKGFAHCLMAVCDIVRQKCIEEPRLLRIDSPVYILGDLHGNFPDLVYFEKVLWHTGPLLSPSTLLFLGDFVDRGAHGVEVVAYLFAYKAQNTNKVKLLRGNHEVRQIQAAFTFLQECKEKFGEILGEAVWQSINNVFDCLPLAAVIDDVVFCCHGGIPPPWLCPLINNINSIPSPLPFPDEQSLLAWEIMWNDPLKAGALSPKVTLELLNNEGFATNELRGTGHVFTAEALEWFLRVNNLSHVIRAHEVRQAGYQINLKQKLLTVFSSSGYCGGNNEAACVLASLNKLLIIRLETM